MSYTCLVVVVSGEKIRLSSVFGRTTPPILFRDCSAGNQSLPKCTLKVAATCYLFFVLTDGLLRVRFNRAFLLAFFVWDWVLLALDREPIVHQPSRLRQGHPRSLGTRVVHS
eukprot:6483116-Amphidinium_carterae.1